MKIRAIEVYAHKLYAHGEYVMSGGRAATHQHSTLVRILADNGKEGWGETATLSGTYLPTFHRSTRAALGELAPSLIGVDPTNVTKVGRTMNGTLIGDSNAKSAIDIAYWDIFGKSVGLPVAALLGGVQQDEFPLYEAVTACVPKGHGEILAGARRCGHPLVPVEGRQRPLRRRYPQPGGDGGGK